MILTIFSKVGNVSFFLWLLSEFSLVFRTLCVWVWFFYPDWSLLRLLDIFIKLGKFLAIVCSNIYSASMLRSFETPIICVWDHLILFYKPLRLYLFSFSLFLLSNLQIRPFPLICLYIYFPLRVWDFQSIHWLRHISLQFFEHGCNSYPRVSKFFFSGFFAIERKIL